ncbi:hypothetical protein NT01EI_2406 [Edwardsiella ictaluri 93-146]|uniref:Uncharacterized protein n=1 Tax=Edwardsiella ictaluri (strain 93-146) TaxID=634503 RepID=C5BA96_EDWI9|nr:hypothetical protein NT01EI_2406 [Edwardsiella ictaluri 93-146]
MVLACLYPPTIGSIDQNFIKILYFFKSMSFHSFCYRMF